MTGLTFYDENIPCLAACPVHTNAGMYVAAIADGNDELAYLTARLPNPFASVCGRVCAAPCEDACRRGQIDRPIAIRALKRFVTEQFGPETGNGRVWEKVAAPPPVERPQSVGIVGGGPAGMACAHDLRRLGYRVTVYEATDKLGGAMWLGIPEYRLDRSVLAADIQAILDLGVEVQYETHLGTDVTLDELRERHDAIFLGIGATLGRGLDIEGGDADGVFKAIEFLINMNRGFEVNVGERVVVIGGGDVAMDAARTALRAGDYASKRDDPAEIAADGRSAMTEALDVARMSVRAGAKQITVISLESREEMPAHDFEVEEALEEGIEFIHRRGPASIRVADGRVSGIETIGVRSVFDSEGRFAPDFDTDDRETFEADTVILAIGQAIDLDALGDSGPEIGPRRTIQIDWETGATSVDGIWSGGDAAKGPRTLIDAIADGRRSAAAIHESFGGDHADQAPGRMVQLSQFHRLDDVYDRWQRVEIPTLETGRRMGLAEVELGFTPEQARCEAARCLRCFANILLDVQRCVLCALCADVCPLDLISLVPSEEAGSPEGGTALLLDETKCIRCALCIERCPTDALSMGMWTGVGVPAWT
ncbi:MAG: FAD-dependent oxidoreductase [Acidimicrobiia bacterium]|nr:FAD-dependent oxidoreductase [Acidimicrobiia bacterium]MDH5293359.1 FAD-dependent oxidoreductase [Acidimicrobiia bacterium]